MIAVSPEQAEGLACVLCGRDFAATGTPSVPVVLPESERKVFVCADACQATPAE